MWLRCYKGVRMRYTRFREYLGRMNRDMRSRDMRNPYGSRGGYVVSDKRSGYDRMGDMAGDREYDRADHNRLYSQSDYAMDSRGNQYDRQSGRDYARRVGYFDYNDDANYDMARGRDMRGDYGYDMRSSRDYAEDEYKLSPSEIRKWEKELKKGTGTSFSKEQVMQVAQQNGIKFDEFTPELLTVITNMMYSDYKDTVKGDLSMYVKLAKDFLCDEDFDGEPEEKAYLYYTAIVSKDD